MLPPIFTQRAVRTGYLSSEISKGSCHVWGPYGHLHTAQATEEPGVIVAGALGCCAGLLQVAGGACRWALQARCTSRGFLLTFPLAGVPGHRQREAGILWVRSPPSLPAAVLTRGGHLFSSGSGTGPVWRGSAWLQSLTVRPRWRLGRPARLLAWLPPPSLVLLLGRGLAAASAEAGSCVCCSPGISGSVTRSWRWTLPVKAFCVFMFLFNLFFK